VDRADLAVIGCRSGLRLAKEALFGAFVVAPLRRQELEGADLPESHIPRGVHDAHAAATELSEHLVVSDGRTHERVGHGANPGVSVDPVIMRLYARRLLRVVIGKEEGTMTKSKSMRIALATFALALIAATTFALGFNHENRLNFTRPVALPGVVLPAGTYSFDVASPTAIDVVVVRSADRRKLYYMGFTQTIERPRRMSANTPIAFGETSANEPPPIAAWYEVGEKTGHQFIYR
jgi:hypothetical protein